MHQWYAAGIRPTLTRPLPRCSRGPVRLFVYTPRLRSNRVPPPGDATHEDHQRHDGSATSTNDAPAESQDSATVGFKEAIRKRLSLRFGRAFDPGDRAEDAAFFAPSAPTPAVSLADFFKQRDATGESLEKNNAHTPRTRKQRLRIRKYRAKPSTARDGSASSAVLRHNGQPSGSGLRIRWIRTSPYKPKKDNVRYQQILATARTSADGPPARISSSVGPDTLGSLSDAQYTKGKIPSQNRPSGARRLLRREQASLAAADAAAGSTMTYKPLSLEEALMGGSLEKSVKDLGASHQLGHGKAGVKIRVAKALDFELTPLSVDQVPVPKLAYDLDRVLFNRGVYQLQDPYSMVYNFDPYLQKIMPVTEFDYNALKEYKTSSQDQLLSGIAKEHDKKYVGSTSSMTGSLAHFHYLLSNWRPLNFSMLSRQFDTPLETFTEINRAPSAMFLRWKNGTHAIDADKQFDGANLLMLLGKSMEKLLTMNTSDFERYRKSDPRQIPVEEREDPEAFHYSTQGDLLMRSQLDAYDPRLPGTGMFDLKTRAVVSVRMRSDEYEEMSGYELHRQYGNFESYEREFYDMVRSTMLKYSLQARMGRMDGIFVAYHNVKRIFGFQYLNLSEMDRALHGQHDVCLGNQEFHLSIELFNQILNKATERFPNQSIRFHFETRSSNVIPFMYIFAEPMSEDDIDKIQNSQKQKIAEYERSIMGVGPRENDQRDAAEAVSGSESGQAEDLAAESGKGDGETCTEADHNPGVDFHEGPREFSTDLFATTSDVTSTGISSSDRAFLSSSEKNKERSDSNEKFHQPLLGMTLTIQSRVNGRYVERPENLGPRDEWEVHYSLTEMPKMSRAWALYEATKARREKVFTKMRGAGKEDENEDAKRAKRSDEYIEMLRRLAQKGRRLRNRIDLIETDREKVVVGEPYSRAEDKRVRSDDVAINGVDDYLRALWSGQKLG